MIFRGIIFIFTFIILATRSPFFYFFFFFIFSFISPPPKHYWILVGAYIAVILTGNITYFLQSLMNFLITLEMWRTMVLALMRSRKPGFLVLSGLIVYAVIGGGLQIFILISGTNNVNPFLVFYLYGMIFLLITMSIHLAKQFASVNYELESINVELENRVARRTIELEQANEELRELDKMKSQFVSQASHDLRTPLTAIKGSLDNLLMGIAGDLNEKQSKIMQRATKSVDRLTNLINDVLDLNRIETGRIILEKTDIPFKTLIENILHENRPAAEQKQIQLSFDAEEGDYTLQIDGGKMERVVGELVSNAIKYTPENGTVDVHLSHDDQQVSLSVQDSGLGMTPDECEKIWDRFYRTTASQKFAKGLGLGLSIAKELVELHQGSIELISQQGQGTTFTLRLPRERNSF